VRARTEHEHHIERSDTWEVDVRSSAVTGHDGLLALCDGSSSVVGSLVLVAGAFGVAADGMVRPLPGPVWTRTTIGAETDIVAWTIDLRRGILFGRHDDGRREVRFVSVARPGLGAIRVESPDGIEWAPPLAAPATDPLAATFEYGAADDASATTVSDRSSIVACASQRATDDDTTHRLDRLVSVHHGPPSTVDVRAALADAERLGVDQLLVEHEQEWERRWQDADITITGDDASQRAIRFAMFHLLSCAAPDEAIIGARALTGLEYAGHVFWDTEMFVLPALAGIAPDRARAAIEYRIRRLPAARREAAARGAEGARFPWESADDGADVTPRWASGPEGRSIPIRTGQYAEHINSDVAWAVHRYTTWTGDTALVEGPGRPLVIDTARYWLSRIRIAEDGTAHIDQVIGPDEYHELVDDNAYTNQLVRWHLRYAADLLQTDGDLATAQRYRDLADRLVDGYDAVRGRHVQFAGFDELDPTPVGELVRRPVAADVLLGRERVHASQIIKQPDVLMLHHVLPACCPAGSLVADLDHDLPRTAHGSSLSPAICASLLARVGRPDEALQWFDIAARLDLDDLTGTTRGGLHLATMGGLWQALVHGFAGIAVDDEGIHVTPHLPRRWQRVEVNVRVRGRPVHVDVSHEGATIDDGASGLPLPVRVATGPYGGCRLTYRHERSRS
jgi:trehalose/maltose hydrolase-like predicted phosphorylase